MVAADDERPARAAACAMPASTAASHSDAHRGWSCRRRRHIRDRGARPSGNSLAADERDCARNRAAQPGRAGTPAAANGTPTMDDVENAWIMDVRQG